MTVCIFADSFYVFPISVGLGMGQAFRKNASYHVNVDLSFHPFWIVAVRGFAKVIHLETILVDNSLIHYLAVCMLSVLSAVVLVRLLPAEKRRIPAHKHAHGLNSANNSFTRTWML